MIARAKRALRASGNAPEVGQMLSGPTGRESKKLNENEGKGTPDEPGDEFCTIISGRVGVVNNDDDSEEVYSAGDSFFVPKGANTTWVIYDTVSKFWMITER